MSTVISSLAELYTNVNARLESALRDTMKELLKELQDIIMREVYSRPISGENWDNRTYEFLESWNTSEPIMVGDMVQSVLSQDGFNFTWNGERGMWSHGNGWSQPLVNYLDDIINNGLSESNFNFPAIEERPYWDMFKIYVEENVNMIFYKNCKKYGLPIMKIGYNFT